LRGGVLVNIVRINWFDSAFGNAPQVNLNFSPASVSACRSDILCYPVQNALFGNGLGYFSEVPSLSQPYGGARNNRVHWYVGDSWRAHPRLTLNLGLRWVYEPGPSNPGLQRPKILADFLPGLSRANRSDTNNFAPQFGIAWAPSASGKWLVRTGAGVFYDVNRLQNALFGERANLLPLGVSGELRGGVVRDAITHRVIFDRVGRYWLPEDGGPALITPGVNWLGRPLGTPIQFTPGVLRAGPPSCGSQLRPWRSKITRWVIGSRSIRPCNSHVTPSGSRLARSPNSAF